MITPALRRAAFLLLLALVTVAFFWIISPFFGAVFWAMVLALMFMPVHRRLCALLRGRDTLAALDIRWPTTGLWMRADERRAASASRCCTKPDCTVGSVALSSARPKRLSSCSF